MLDILEQFKTVLSQLAKLIHISHGLVKGLKSLYDLIKESV